MQLRLHNSRTRRVEDFVPADARRVTMYLCGPTVYNFVHIGNARGPVVFGVLVRLLRHIYGAAHIIYARNVTDVDDKINAAAAESGLPIDAITRRFAAAYDEDMVTLGVDAPDIVPYATAHMSQILTMCETLIGLGHAYAAQSHVLFDVSSYPDYGRLSGRSTDEMIAGARVDVAPYKRNPADFVLWKPSTPDLPGWDSPWGRGRPGWHIECSAMSAAHLGETIDIHAGGNDLIFPHHENEVAQSTCAHGGKLFARFWLHNGMLTFDGRKMSKSLGNTLQLHELLLEHPPELLRYMLMKAHYRQPLDWSERALEQARATLDGWYTLLRDLADVPAELDATPATLLATLADDLNTPEALAVLARLAETARKSTNAQDKQAAKAALLGAGKFLGLLQVDPEQWFKQGLRKVEIAANITAGPTVNAELSTLSAADIDRKVADRQDARKARNFTESDRIRDELLALGVIIEDTAQGPRWKVVKTNERAA